MEKYRNEWKFLVDEAQMELIRHRIAPLMRRDTHQDGGSYNVRSLYFDDYGDSCLEENETGVDRRKKYRVRIYNKTPDPIRLEIKSKYRGMGNKYSCYITEDQCRLLMAGKTVPRDGSAPGPLRDLDLAMRLKGMHPVCIVEYERSAYVYRQGNVRVTFDRNIAAGYRTGDFLSRHTALMPILQSGRHILEVKFDEFLPDFIAQFLEVGSLTRTTFSKYYLCRKGGM